MKTSKQKYISISADAHCVCGMPLYNETGDAYRPRIFGSYMCMGCYRYWAALIYTVLGGKSDV